jgi:hypothetical protein
MAAATYTTDLAVLTLCDATTGITEPTGSAAGGTPSLEADYFIQGTNCVSKTFNATGVGGLAYTAGAAVTIPTDGAAYTWVYYACPNAVGSKAAGGIQILIGNSTAAYKRFYVAGSDTYTYGGWVNYPVNPTIASSLNEGSPTAVTQVFGYAINSVNSVTKGNPFGLDAIRYGRGTLQVVGGDLANGYGTFTAASTQNDSVTNRWGILSFVDGGFKFQGHLLMGTAATAVDFRDSGKNVTIQPVQFVTSAFNTFEVRNAASVVQWTDMSFLSLSTVSRGNFLVTNNAAVTLNGCTFNSLGTFTFLAATVATGCVFNKCNLITHGNSTFTSNQIVASNASTAMITATPGTIQNCTFTSAGTGHALELTTAGTYSFSGNKFVGYGTAGTTNAAIYNNSGGAITLNISGGGDSPTVRNGAGASTTIVASANLSFDGLQAGSEVRVYLGTDPATATEIGGTESSGTLFTVSQSYGGQQGFYTVHALTYNSLYQPITFSGADQTIPIVQSRDRTYFNP